jgi:hypothetical protein
MPKKTKRQKIESQIRREKMLSQGYSVNFVKTELDQTSIKAKIQQQSPSKTLKNVDLTSQKHFSTDSYHFVKKDLIRITIFTIFAFVIQGVLYFLLGIN